MDLRLAVKDEYFQDIKSGRKPFEFRLDNEYWRKRLVGRNYDYLIITSGYPRHDQTEKIYRVPYRGYEMQTITHKHFDNKPEHVFAIYTQEQK